MTKNYELLEHTADIAIRVKGKTLKDLFSNAALAMFDILAEKNPQSKVQSLGLQEITVKLKAEDSEGLFVNWLNELLSLSATKDIIFEEFQIEKLDKNNVEAIAKGSDIKNYKLKTEIKAATYHQLKLEQVDSAWQLEVIFDV